MAVEKSQGTISKRLRDNPEGMMRLRPLALALAGGILWAASVFAATLWIVITGGTGQTMALLGKFYLGYAVTVPGAFVGLVWGFVDGFLAGLILAWLYNVFTPAPRGTGGETPTGD
jgi:hypothetical protein